MWFTLNLQKLQRIVKASLHCISLVCDVEAECAFLLKMKLYLRVKNCIPVSYRPYSSVKSTVQLLYLRKLPRKWQT